MATPADCEPLAYDPVADAVEVETEFPWRRLLRLFEGGSVELAENDGSCPVIIENEALMADLLAGTEDEDLVRPGTLGLRRFADIDHRARYLAHRGWYRRAPQSPLDRWVRTALTEAATTVEKVSKHGEWPLERDLKRAIVANLEAADPNASVEPERRLNVVGWNPQPHGVDVYARSGSGATAILELKIDAPGETLWDIYKLLASDLAGGSNRRYSVLAVKDGTLARAVQGAELFRVDPRDPPWIEDTTRLLERNTSAWAWTLKATAQPRELPGEIAIEPFFAAPMRRAEGFQLRAIAVSVPEKTHMITLVDGQPV
jgi:hypothetical protein